MYRVCFTFESEDSVHHDRGEYGAGSISSSDASKSKVRKRRDECRSSVNFLHFSFLLSPVSQAQLPPTFTETSLETLPETCPEIWFTDDSKFNPDDNTN